MAVVPFTYYLHDESFHERLDTFEEETGVHIEMDDELYQKMGRPFYEVKLNCTLDTETGDVTMEIAK